MNIPIKIYQKKNPHTGRLIELTELENRTNDFPYVFCAGDVFIIGPLIVYTDPAGTLTSINPEDGLAIPSFVKSEEKEKARAQFIGEAKTMRKGSYLALHNLRSYNFWHWMMEAMPRIIMAKMAGFKGYYIVPPELSETRFVKESFSLLGEDLSKIISYNGEALWVETLFIPKPINGQYELMYYPLLIRRIRSLMMGGMNPDLIRKTERIYIPRLDTTRTRKVVNEAELYALLKKYGFHKVVMETLTLREQIQTMVHANAIVGPHGAGMTHALFMKPQSLIIELFSPLYINPCLLAATEYLKHRYYMVPSTGINYPHGEDVVASLEFIETTLRRELRG